MPRVNVDIPEALKARVDRVREGEKRSLRAVVELALEQYCENAERQARTDES